MHSCPLRPALLLLLYAIATCAAETGTIQGRVVDRETGKRIPGVVVAIDGVGVVAATDTQGFYRMSSVPAGPRRLFASCFGYRDLVQVGALVIAGQTLLVDFALAITSAPT